MLSADSRQNTIKKEDRIDVRTVPLVSRGQIGDSKRMFGQSEEPGDSHASVRTGVRMTHIMSTVF